MKRALFIRDNLNEESGSSQPIWNTVYNGLLAFFDEEGKITEIGGDEEGDYLDYIREETRDKGFFANDDFQYTYEFSHKEKSYRMELSLESDFEYNLREVGKIGSFYDSESPSEEEGDIEVSNLILTDIGVYTEDDKEVWHVSTDDPEFESFKTWLQTTEEGEELIDRITGELREHVEELLN